MQSNQPFLRRSVAGILCLIVPAVLTAAEAVPSYKLKYDGGSLPSLKTGADVKLIITPEILRFLKGKEETISIPATSIIEVSYGQDVHRRVGAAIGLAVVSLGIGALMLLAKSKKHYIGLTWETDGKKGGAAFQADKSDYRGVLAGIEGVTGKKAVNSDALTVKN